MKASNYDYHRRVLDVIRISNTFCNSCRLIAKFTAGTYIFCNYHVVPEMIDDIIFYQSRLTCPSDSYSYTLELKNRRIAEMAATKCATSQQD